MNLADPQSFDGFAEQYDAAVSIERSHDFFLKSLPERRGSVLEIGCGTGLLAYELSHHFSSVVALDISEPMLTIARKKRSAPNIEYQCSDANKLTVETSFDAIVSHTTFHHLTSIPETVSAVRAALAPGGRLILLDCITRFGPIIPRWTICYYAYAGLQLLPDSVRRGFEAAWTLFRFRCSRQWIAHLKSDRYLTREQFREVYASLLPGAQFTCMKTFIGVVWTAPREHRMRKEPNHALQPTPLARRG